MKSLARCPQCRYSLKGLPADHRCPECGFEYDAATAVWEYRLDKKEIWGYIVVSCILVWMLLNRGLSGTFPPRSVFGILAVLFGALTLFVMYRAYAVSRAGYAVCTTGRGLMIKIGRKIDLYPWADVEAVFWNAADKVGGVKLRSRDRPLHMTKVLRKQPDFKDFELEVHRRKQVEEEKLCSES